MNDNDLDAILSAGYHRQACPPLQVLNDYQAGLLLEGQRANIQTHLDECPHCPADLENLTGYLAQFAPAAASPQPQPWKTGAGFEWQQIAEAGQLFIRMLKEAFTPPAQMAALNLVKGNQDQDDALLRHIRLTPAETGGADIEARVEATPDQPELSTLLIRVQIPERWPDLDGVQVIAGAGSWVRNGMSDMKGEVTLDGLPQKDLDKLAFEIKL